MFKFFYRSKKKSTKGQAPPATLDEVRTWKATGNARFLQKAVNGGFDTSLQVDDTLGSALHVSAQHSYLESLFVLHATGTRDVTQNPRGQYAVHLAAGVGFRDGVLYMLKNMGADIDARDSQGATPLMLAIENDRLDVASALLARGARVARPNSSSSATEGPRSSEGKLAAIHLCKSPAMLRLLLTTTTLHVDARSTGGQTLLHKCSAYGDTATAAECLALGANCNAVDRDKANALHHACRNSISHIIPLLVKAGCSASDPDAGGFTPVEVALLRHDCDTAYALYCAGALFTKRQLLLLSILLRHSSLLRAIRSERKVYRPGEALGPTIHTLEETAAAKVETQAAALLATHDESEPQRLAKNTTSPPVSNTSLSNLVVSVGKLPEGSDITAENLDNMFQKLHDPIPRPVGTESSAVLVSVYSRFLRHSDSSVQGGLNRWRTARVGRVPGTQQHTMPEQGDPECPANVSPPQLPQRHSESVLDIHATPKSAFWTSTIGHPPGGPTVAGKRQEVQLVHADRQEAANKLEPSQNAASGRSSLERLLPHYLLGLSQFVSQGATPSELRSSSPKKAIPAPGIPHATPAPTATTTTAQPTAVRNAASSSFARVRSDAASSAAAAAKAKVLPAPHASGSLPPALPSTREPLASHSINNNAACTSGAPPRPRNVQNVSGGVTAGSSQRANRPPQRRSFCGQPPPEASAFAAPPGKSPYPNDDFGEHRRRDVRKSAFFSRGKTEPTVHPMARRSRTFDLGYRHSEIVGVPVSRGHWGQPQALPGPGGARGNPNTRTDAARMSQDDIVIMHKRSEMPQHGQDLAADGMMEFEEMMARRVRMFQGDMQRPEADPSAPQRQGEQPDIRHIDSGPSTELEPGSVATS